MLRLEFHRGTLLLRCDGDLPAFDALVAAGVRADARVKAHRAPARCYRAIVLALRAAGVAFEDAAREYEECALHSRLEREPFPHQSEALEAWWEAGGAGVVVLPTGAGKTFVAQLAMQKAGRSALVVTPTIDLMQQWYGVLGASFGGEIGLLGGGYHEPRTLTVATYDSAWMYMEQLGARFGLVVFDECHHLPSPSLALAAECCLAPFRLGLTATPEREDGQEARLADLIGPTVYRRDIKELAGTYLADYETIRVAVPLSDEERERYEAAREVYRAYAVSRGIRLGSPSGFAQFLRWSSRDAAGRRALRAYREQRAIALAAPAKLKLLQQLLLRHRSDRVLVFTNDNATVHEISRRFLIPAITHQTKVKERQEILRRFNSGEYPFLVTSKVLNEGVDVPAASIAIVLSGSGTVREHVQRLGRVLRRGEGKRARLYEVVAHRTAEEYVSQRRRQHDAYR